MEIKDFIDKLERSNFSLSVENDRLLLNGDKKKLSRAEIDAIKKDDVVINYIKENKQELINFLSAPTRAVTEPASKKVQAIYRLSGLQEGMLFHGLYDGQQGAYIEQFSCDLSNLSLPAFIESWKQVISKHSILRSAFHYDKFDLPVQTVYREAELPVDILDYRDLNPAQQKTAIKSYEDTDIARGFDFKVAPLMRIGLIRMEEDRYRMLWTSHHILFDGWSRQILMEELLSNYELILANTSLPAKEDDRYEDYIRYIERIDKHKEEAFWKQASTKLEGPTLLPFVHQSQDRTKGGNNYNSTRLSFSQEQSIQVQLFAQQNRLTVNTIMQGVWAYLLHQYTGNRAVAYGVIVSGRPDDLPGVEKRVGLYINTLPLYSFFNEEQTRLEWLQQLQESQVEARQYQHTPLSSIQKWSGISGDMFDSLFVFENYPISKVISERKWSIGIDNFQVREQTNYPLTLLVSNADQLSVQFSYNTGLLNEKTIEMMKQHFEKVLLQLAGNTTLKLPEIEMLPPAELKQVLYDFNTTGIAYPQDETIAQLFELQVVQTPGAVALTFAGEHLTYQQLNDRANQLAHYLLSEGVEQDQLVPICIERSFDMIVGVLAILKLGAVYVPIDPEYPAARISYMLKETAASLVVSSSRCRQQLIETGVTGIIELDTESAKILVQSTDNVSIPAQAGRLAYILYTSGSTGTPKGVKMPEASLVNLLHWQESQFKNHQRRVLQFASLNFDVSFQEIFSTLCFGSSLHLIDELRRKDMAELADDIRRVGLTHLFLPYIVLKSLAEHLQSSRGNLGTIEEVIVAGEQLKVTPDIAELLSKTAVKLVNQYGPTEAHVVSSYTIDKNYLHTPLPPIGKPVSNVQLYVLNAFGKASSIGVPGELFIGGAQLATGYLNRPELTEERFIANTISPAEGARLYKTGDLVRWLDNGNMEYLGRIDEQVKIRGFRVELGEVETALQQSGLVRQAVVLAKEERTGSKRLVGYVIPTGEFNREELIAYLEENLPAYMVPALWVEMDHFPTSPNGKVDKKLLQEPDATAGTVAAYVEPTTNLEIQLATIWKDLLGVVTPGIHDNFFELGGHSLLAMRAVSAVRRALKSEVAIKDFFEHPTIHELSVFLLNEGYKELLPAIHPVNRNGKLELSFSQERLWFIDQFEGSTQYHIPAVLRLKGALDIAALEFALQSIVERHEILRTVYHDNQGQVFQVVQPANNWTLDREAALEENALAGKIKFLVQVPFDLSKDYMFRATIIPVQDAEHLLVTSMHHIASDGWSISIIVKEVSALYESFSTNVPSSLTPLPIQYADYAAWQRKYLQGAALDKKLNYWKEQLQGVKPLELPTDYSRPRVATTGGSAVGFSLDKELSNRLNQLGKTEGATLFMTLLAGFKLLLFRYTEQQDICVGTPIANRPQPEVEGLVGFFLNTLALRSNVDGRTTFSTLLRNIKETTLQAYAHQDVPFEKVVEAVVKERDVSRSPLFQVMFVLHNTPEVPELRLGDVLLAEETFVNTTSKYDLVFSITETPGGLRGSVQYSTDLYRVETIESMLAHFVELLESVTANPNEQIGAVRMLDKTEEQALIAEFNTTEVAYPKNSLVDLFQEQADKTPGNIALVAGDKEITYAELNERANQLAAYLQSKGVNAETLVPICIGRSIEMMVGILAILKAGAAYVPVDPAYPPDRIRFMLEDAQATILLTADEHAGKVLEVFSEEKMLRLDSGWDKVAGYPKSNPEQTIEPGQLAYVLYTSGSTGKPKGVQVQHDSLAQHLHWFNRQYNISEKDSTLLTSSFSFDGGMTSIWPVLTKGGQLHLSPDGIFDPESVLKYISKHALTYLKTLPGIFKALIQAENFKQDALVSSLRLVILGGERIDPIDLRSYMLQYPGVIFSNHYGPTECTISSSFYLVDKNNIAEFTKQPLIGRPVDNTRIYVVNQNGQLNPIGVAGEICIAGAGVARGYLNQPALTREKFVADTFVGTTDCRMYKTGDLGRWLHDGNIEFLGRIDDQVKIRGYRVEPGEIENALVQTGLLRQAVVIAKDAADGNQVLVGYVVPLEQFDQQQLIESLKVALPEYMIPSVWVQLQSMPVTPNGKADRKALPDVDAIAGGTAAYAPPRNQTEEQFVAIWQQLLGKDQVGINDNFFEIGGHSLLGMRVISATRNKLNVELSVKDIFVYPTIAELAAQVSDQNKRSALPTIEKQDRPPLIPLSFSQERIWFIDQLEGTVPYHMPTVLRLKGAVNVDALQQTLRAVVERHEVLRTLIKSQDGRPYQVVQESDGWKLMVTDVSSYSKEALEKHQQQLVNQPFRLSKDFMLRANLLKVAAEEHLLVVTMHHIASDGWSSSVLVKDVVELYRHFTEGAPLSLQNLPIQYADFAIWQRQLLQDATLENKLAYWKEKLEDIAPLQLPADFPRTNIQSNRGHISKFMVDKAILERLQVLSRQQEASLFMTLLSAFNVFLYRYTNQTDICVGTGIAGRQYQELEGLIGFFVNTLALRNQVNGDHSFTEILQQVKQTTLEAYEHQEVPFEKVVDAVAKGRDTGRTPLFQVMFALSNIPEVPTLDVGGLQLVHEVREHTTAKFDLTFILKETPTGLRVIVEYATDLFTEMTIAKMVRHFTKLLESITADPAQQVLSLPILNREEIADLQEGSKGPELKFATEKTVTVLFEEQVLKNPTALAVVFGEEQFTYGELNERANQLAHFLQKKGVGAEMIVPVCIERSTELLVAILSILKTGAAYVPIDPDYPQDRISYLLQDTAASLVVCSSNSRAKIEDFVEPQLVEINGEHAVVIGQQPASNLNVRIKANQLAYVIYTSGSTGQPKGVMIEHKSLLNYLLNTQAQYIDVTSPASGTFLHLSYTFDASLTGIFMPLVNGKALVIGKGSSLEVFEDSNLWKHAPYDFIKITPSHLELLETTTREGQEWLTNKLVIGGEALHLNQFDHFVSQRVPITAINEYGPTEATVGCSTYSFNILANNENIAHNIPIGKPMDNVDLYIVDERNQLLPAGVAGELCIGGAGLGRGYLNQPELTAAKFIDLPFTSGVNTRLYKTGDLARWLPNGNIEFLGRIDDQVKVKGYRIELGEIETAISQADDVKQARVMVADTKLNAYVQVDKDKLPLLSNFERMLNSNQVQKSDLNVLPNGLPILSANLNEVRFLYNEIFEDHCYLKHGITLHPESVVIDIGANVGFFTTFLNVLSENIKVYSFEPIPEVYHFLSANRELYGVKGKAFQVAIMDVEKEVEFTYYPQVTIVSGISEDREQVKEVVRSYIKHSDTNELVADEIDSLLEAKLESKRITVKTKTISQVIREENIEKIDLLKVDVENSEHLVINGLADEDWEKISSIIIEIHDVDGRLASIKQTLEDKGFNTFVEKEQMLSEDDILYNLFALKPSHRRGYTTLGDRDVDRATGWCHPQDLVKNIRTDLEKRLPEYMLPSNIILVDHFPLTRNGKLDKRALPQPASNEQVVAASEFAETENEINLLRIWKKLLDLEEIGVQDNFFELGGDSLTAVRLVSLIRKELSIEIPISSIFEFPTIASLANRFNTTPAELPAAGIKVGNRPAQIPLAFSQERLWFVDKLEGTLSYHLPAVLRLKGKLNIDALGHAIQEIINRHEVLRTVIYENEGAGFQRILPPNTWKLDLAKHAEFKNDPAQLQAFKKQLIAVPFDLSKDHMLRATLVELSAEEFLLVVTMHHIASDGWSLSILVKEVVELYSAFQENRAAVLPALPLQFADFAIWQRSQLQGKTLEEKLAYWQQKLAGTEPLLLPVDYTRPPVQSNRGAVIPFTVDNQVADKLKAVGQQQGATLFMTLLSAFKVLMHRYSGQEDICVGTPVAGRQQQEIEGLIGFFLNTLALRTQVSPQQSFTEVLSAVKQTTLEAYAHQELPFEKVVDAVVKGRDISRSPLFQVVFVLQNIPEVPNLEFAGVTLSSEAPALNTTKFEILCHVKETPAGLIGTFTYATDLFSEESIHQLIAHFKSLLNTITVNPAENVGAMSLLAPGEKDQLISGFNQTSRYYPAGKTMVDLFEAQAQDTPGHPALEFGEQVLSYRELNERANQVARYLKTAGIRENSFVPLCIERGVEMIVGLLAILKTGAAYVPVDPGYPEERIKYILDDLKASLVLSSSTAKASLLFNEELEVLELDLPFDMVDNQAVTNLGIRILPTQPAYVIFTSGSTGRPKGVIVPHKGNVNMSLDQVREFGITPTDKVFQFASISFDASVYEIFMAFYGGATLVLPAKSMIQDTGNFAAKLQRSGVTVIVLPPVYLKALRPEELIFLRVLITAGESADVQQAAYLSGLTDYYNAYGPTEYSVCASLYKVSPADKNKSRIPIGKPIANTRIYILNEALQVLPIGVAGEMFIAGEGLAIGYLNKPDLTAEKFIVNPFNSSETLYRTGDLARWLPDGNLEFIGRTDDQVKIRGYRVELGEIEQTLDQHEAVENSVVLLNETKTEKQLVAYYTSKAQEVTDIAALRDYLKSRLPEYMVPSIFIAMEAFPVNVSGKIDKKALPQPDFNQVVAEAYVQPANELENQLVVIWQDLLELDQVGVSDNFFELGGHSLLAIRLISVIRKELNMEVPIGLIFDNPTVESLAAQLTVLSSPALLPAITKQARTGNIPLSFSQERMWFLDRLQGSIQHHVPAVLRLTGALDKKALEQALQLIINRHEVLRTVITEIDGEGFQVVLPEDQWSLFLINEPQYQQDPAKLATLVSNLLSAPFDLSKDHMIRATLVTTSEAEHLLVVTMHHIASDGWSAAIIVKELVESYSAFTEGRSTLLPEVSIQYADYAIWQRQYLQGEVLDKKLAYWVNQLEGVTPLELSADFNRPSIQSAKGALARFQVDKALMEKLEQIGQEQGATLFMTLLTAFNVLLNRYSGQEDICIGTSVAGRQQKEIEGLVGFFINTLALRTSIQPGASFTRLLQEVKATTLDAYSNQEVPFEKVVDAVVKERDLSRNPLFQVMFVLQNTMEVPVLKLGSVTLIAETKEHHTTQFDLTLNVSQSENGLFGSFQYSTELYTAETINRMIAHFKTLLEAIAASPSRQVGDLNILSAQERQQLLVDFNNTAIDFPATNNIIELFEGRVTEMPTAIALIFGDEEMTYEELNGRANQLAHHLSDKGVKSGQLVAVCIDRSTEMIIAILAILKAGAAYLPVDPEYPAERIDYLLEDSGATIVLTNTVIAKDLPVRPTAELVALDTLANLLVAQPNGNPQTNVLPGNLAYVIYTSGSTGKPKGVMVEHGGVINLAYDQQRFLDLERGFRWLQFASIGFDASCYEIFNTLLGGGALVLCTKDQLLSAKEFKALVTRHQIDIATLPPSYLYNVADDLGTIKTIVSAGEALNETIGKYIQSKGIRLVNGYGPTENTIAISFSAEPIREDHTVVIGKPVSNVQVYILDQRNNLLPVNSVGEICVGGAQVARGYLNRPELTREKFIADPFSSKAGARLYRTGDLGRWLPDGNLEYLGRIDEQVKIRGYRVEPGEIENMLSQHPSVGQAVVVVNSDTGHNELVAYIVPSTSRAFDKILLQQFLRNKLPEYMVPALWVALDQLPLTVNGKVDKKALPSPDQANEALGFVAPVSELEIGLARIWETILPISAVGTKDNFFEAGGNSLLAMRVISLIRREFEIDLPIKQLFLHPTISGLAEVMQQQLKDDLVPAIKTGSRPEHIPLSFSQERLWFIDQMEGTVQYHIPVILRLKGNLDIAALRHALTEVVNRHEALRTVIREVEGQGYQYILPADSWELTITDGAPYQDAATLKSYVHTLTQAPFDLSSGHMLRAELIRLSETEQVLVATMHHIASDGWSASILVREVVELYQSFTEKRPAHLQPLPVQYADYALWQRTYLQGEVWENKLNYWKTKLEGAAALQLPTDHPRPALQTTHGATTSFHVNKDIATRLQAFSQQQGTTLFMTLLAGFKVLLHRYSGQEDITVGTPIANRTQHETEQLIGFFVNTLALRSEVKGAESFTQLVQQVKTTTLEAYTHQDVPFEKVVETVMKSRDLSRSPLFQVMFVLQNTPDVPELKFGDVQLSAEGFTQQTAKYDLSLFVTDNGNGLQGAVEYNTDLYEEATIRKMMVHFEQLLLSVLENPAQEVGRLAMLQQAEEAQLLFEFNDTDTAFPQDKSIVDLFELQATKTPDATALVFETESLSYRELNERSNQLAHYLQERGVTSDTLVPVCIERSVGMITAILGILKAGGAYVPIDPEYPQDRISYMLEDTGAKLVVSSEQSRSKLANNTGLEIIEPGGKDASEINKQPISNLATKPAPGQLIYVIYTSGSTGKPKGVKMPATAMANLLTWQEKQFTNPQRRVLQFASLTFDVSFQEIFSTLCFGSRLYLISATRRKDISAMVRDIHSQEITHLFIPYIVLKSLAEYAQTLTSHDFSIEEIIVAGEQLKLTDDIQALLDKTNIRLVNQYGPTEAHVVSQYVVEKTDKAGSLPPIGKPVDNTRLYVLNAQHQLSPVGVPGELYIGGAQVASGYVGKAALTKEKFLLNPFGKDPGAALYRTGDQARWLPDGNLEYLGRIDEQVKIRGYRVELGEIENILQQHEQVQNAVVLAKEDSTGNKRLVAYVLAAEIFDKQALVTWLTERLPEYMVPALWVQLDHLPQTPNGKVDRKALPDPDMTNLGTGYVAPSNELESVLAEIWQEVLGVQRVGMNDNFFELGGHSLMVMKLVSQVKKRLSLAIPIQAIFQFPTIGQLSEYLEWSNEEDTTSYDVINI